MIGGLRGTVARRAPGLVLVDVGGVLYEVAVSMQAFTVLPGEGEPVTLDIVTHVREDTFALFGFVDPREKLLFGWLKQVSGVGPRLALNILSGLPADQLIAALGEEDAEQLRRVPGVGKKTAERLVLELSERAREAAAEAPLATPAAEAPQEEALSALLNLGYKRGEAERVLKEIGSDVPLEEAIREALRRFAR